MKKSSCLLAGCLLAITVLAQGTRENPVNITSRAELEAITNSTGHYQLASDIDLGGENWNPLFQDYENGFSGTLLDNGMASDDYETLIELHRKIAQDEIDFLKMAEWSVNNKDYEQAEEFIKKVEASGYFENSQRLHDVKEAILQHL